ncbi:T9SS type A sorting domain-containing protein [Maribacter vaceletii]|nr:right-handed parallel beta-helix repeat-containing protein [Maribacter vaceletii]
MNKLLFTFLFIFFTHSIILAQTIYVATDGDDNNNGSESTPYKTFSKAISEMSAGDICIIKGGVYEEQLSMNKNGTPGNPLTFKAADGETVEIKATSTVDGWEIHNGNIYKADVDMAIESRFRAVYHNNDYMDLARWPNNTDNNRWTIDCQPVTGGDGAHFLADNIPNIDWTGGMVYYLATHSGTSWTRPITASSTNRIEHAGVDINKWPFSNHNPQWTEGNIANPHGQLFLFNKLEALDSAREWYYDNVDKVLYLQTANGNIPTDGSVQYATRKYAIELNGDYIKLEGLEIFGGAIKIHNNADNNQIINCKVIHGSEGHDSLTNASAQVGESAIEVLGDNTIIKGCTINHSSTNGILVAGWAADDCIIEENTISNLDYVGIHASPIRSSGDNMKILKNTIFTTGRDGMYVAGTGNEIAYNDVSASQKINSDSGVFYTVGNDNLRNSEIHHNWFHDATAPSYSHNPNSPAKAAGIYLDNDSKGFTVHHNVVWNVSWSGYQVNWNNTNLDFYHNTIWNAERAMDSWDINGPQLDNKIYNNYANTGEWFTKTATDFEIKDSPIFADSPFEDADNQNFMPAIGSALVDMAPIITGFNKPFKGNSPDIGAYELGGTRWTAGINAIEDTGEGIPWSVLNTQFTIATTTETCPNQNNGKVNIVANYPEDYVVAFNGTNTNFTTETTLENIEPGTYDFCISINGDTESQCFSVEIKEADEIQGISLLTQNKLSVNIEKGTAPFRVSVNDKVIFKTSEKSFSVDVKHGDTVEVKSDVTCEGTIIEPIDLQGNVVAYPNPTQGNFQLSLPVHEGKVIIELYDMNSQLISSKLYPIESGTVDLNIENNPDGIYFAKIKSKKPTNVKIIKN